MIQGALRDQHSTIAAAKATLRITSRIRDVLSFIAMVSSVNNAKLPLQNLTGTCA